MNIGHISGSNLVVNQLIIIAIFLRILFMNICTIS